MARKWIIAIACAIALIAACGGLGVHFFVGALNDSKDVKAQLVELPFHGNPSAREIVATEWPEARKLIAMRDRRGLTVAQEACVTGDAGEPAAAEQPVQRHTGHLAGDIPKRDVEAR